jgi:hypothetical protein
MTPLQDYPYLNLSLCDIPGERWKDVPEFEGIYQASDLGRIKSLDREINHPLSTHKQFLKGKVLKQSITSYKNIKTGEPMVELGVCLSKGGKQYYFITRRVIYSVFMINIDYKNDALCVINADGDGFNNKVVNLKLVTKSQKTRRTYLRDRMDSFLKNADRSTWTKIYGGYVKAKPVKQFTVKGKLINQYASIREAARQTGCDAKSIIAAARGMVQHVKGYRWEYADQEPGVTEVI